MTDTLFTSDLAHLSRREFLRWLGRGALGLFALPFLDPYTRRERLNHPPDGTAVSRVRCVDDHVAVYDRPSFSAALRQVYWRDLVFEVDEVVIGDEQPAHNRVWYHLKGKGFAHSGKLQPVEVRLNPPASSVPPTGWLAEVTVPYTDTLRDLNRPDRPGYRLYYSTVHWVQKVLKDGEGAVWYQLWDDKFKRVYYARAEHLHLLKPEEIAPLAETVPPEAKRIEVWLKDQLVIAYENDEPVLITRAATGGKFIDGDYSTPQGRYLTNRKRPSRHMASGDLAAPNSYDLPGVPWVCYLTESGISFHGTYWHNDFGKPRSHGCINLSPAAARWIYRWTHPAVPFDQVTWWEDTGTSVVVRG